MQVKFANVHLNNGMWKMKDDLKIDNHLVYVQSFLKHRSFRYVLITNRTPVSVPVKSLVIRYSLQNTVFHNNITRGLEFSFQWKSDQSDRINARSVGKLKNT